MTTKPVIGTFSSVGDTAWTKTDGTQLGAVNGTTGAWTVGPSGFTGTHPVNGSMILTGAIDVTTTGGGSNGGVKIRDYPGDPGNAYLQFVNNAANSQYSALRASNGLLSSSTFISAPGLSTPIVRFNAGGGMAIQNTATTQIGNISEVGQLDIGANLAGGGTRIFHQMYAYGSTGAGGLIVSAPTGLANGEQVCVRASAGGVTALFGVNKSVLQAQHWPFLQLDSIGFGLAYYWTDSSLQFRRSTDGNHIGTTNGTVVGDQTSDERLKQNITPTKYGLSTVLDLLPIDFEMDGVAKVGFGAQTTLPVIPEAVYDTGEVLEDSTKLAMSYTTIIPVLVKAIQELKAELDASRLRQ